MNVVIAREARKVASGRYHLLDDDRAASLCGSINEESQFASSSSRVLSREAAEGHGYEIRGRCSYIAENRSVAASEADD